MNWIYDESKRNRIGSAAMVLGFIVAFVGLFVAVYFGSEGFVSKESLNNVSRWIPVTVGQLIAVGASQLIVGGAFLVWVTGKPMSWARAGFATFLTWFELILVYGIIPSEWLNLTQGPLGWTDQKVFLTVPKWLLLNNDVEISFSVLKDAISGGYHMVVLGLGIVFAYKIQGFGKGEPAAAPDVASPYGRPLTKATK